MHITGAETRRYFEFLGGLWYKPDRDRPPWAVLRSGNCLKRDYQENEALEHFVNTIIMRKAMDHRNRHCGLVAFMPDGKPAPAVMLEKDLIRFLRLKELGVKNPVNTLRYYRERGKLRATRIANRNCYTIGSALEFLEAATDKPKPEK